jgi:hypothetical protein
MDLPLELKYHILSYNRNFILRSGRLHTIRRLDMSKYKLEIAPKYYITKGNGFIIKLHQVNIIDDFVFLTAIASALSKIVNLSNIFGRFKETILATTTVKLPKSAHDTKIIIEGVMDEINCAMQYIGHFVDASFSAPSAAELSTEEKNIIDKAVQTIDNWNILCEHGISVALESNVDIQYIQQSSNELKQTTNVLKTATNKLKTKLAQYKYC